MNFLKRLSLKLRKGGEGIQGLVVVLVSGIVLTVVAVIYSTVIQGSLLLINGTAGTFAEMAGWSLWIASFLMIIAPAIGIVYKQLT